MTRLVEALQLLACPADAQLAALPSFVVAADEIALIFDDQLRAADLGSFDAAVRDRLAWLDRKLSELSATSSRWTVAALRIAPEWAELRRIAAEILAALSIPIAAPDLSWMTYIP